MAKKIKEALSKALGLRETEGDEITEHKKLRSQLIHRRENLNKIEAILNDLKAEYTRRKNQIFFIRYWSMKRMIRSSMERLRLLLNDVENQSSESEVEGQGQVKDFAANARKLADLKQYYAELSTEQLGEDLLNFPVKIQQLDEEFSMRRELLEQLNTNYQNSKTQLYHKRYSAMKQMIKSTFSDSDETNLIQ